MKRLDGGLCVGAPYADDLDGKLFPVGWLRLLWRLKFGPCHSVHVPLMGVLKQHQKTRMGAALALSMIDRLQGRTGVDLSDQTAAIGACRDRRGV